MNISRYAFFGLVLVSSCSFLGWHNVTKGKGPLVTVPQSQIQQFDSITVADNFTIMYENNPYVHEVVLEAHENLLPLIEIRQESCCLYIGLKKNAKIKTKTAMRVFIKSPRLRSVSLTGAVVMEMAKGLQDDIFKVELSGASQLNAELFCVDYLYAKISGAAKVVASMQKNLYLETSGASDAVVYGIAEKASIKASGSSRVDSSNAAISSMNIFASGASQVEVAVSNILQVVASGTVSVRYKGQPKVDVQSSGNASIKPLL